jgi:hypothetical protein
MSTVRTASIFARGGSTPNRCGPSPVSTQRQNFFGRQQEMLVERVCRNGQLDPFAAARNDRKDGRAGGGDPHIVL